MYAFILMAAGKTELAHKLNGKSHTAIPKDKAILDTGQPDLISYKPHFLSFMNYKAPPRSQESSSEPRAHCYSNLQPLLSPSSWRCGRRAGPQNHLSYFSSKNQLVPFPSSQDHVPRFQHLQEVTHLHTERVHGRQPSEQAFHWGTYHQVIHVPCISGPGLQSDGQDRNCLPVCPPWLFIVATEWRKQTTSHREAEEEKEEEAGDSREEMKALKEASERETQ